MYITIPGGFQYKLLPGEETISLSNGTVLPACMVTNKDSGGEYGWHNTTATPRHYPSGGCSESGKGLPLEEQLALTIEGIMTGDTSKLNSWQRRNLDGIQSAFNHYHNHRR